MARVGTLAWAADTDGRLRARDYLALTRQAVSLQTRTTAGPVLARLTARHRPPTSLPISSIELPTTDAAVTARQIIDEHAAPHLVEHSVRTYYWARVFAHRDNLNPDDEVLFVAALLHDLGLTPSHSRPQPERGCFTVPGSHTAARVARDRGWTSERIRAVAEAITMHLNPSRDGQAGHRSASHRRRCSVRRGRPPSGPDLRADA